MYEVLYESLIIYMLVFARIGAIMFFNPIFSRSNVPNQYKLIFVLWLSVVIVPTINISGIYFETDFSMFLALSNELMLGFALNFVFIIFYYMIYYAGDTIDFAFGLSMAKVFDPGTNMQMSLTGNLLTILFTIYFFAMDCHLLFIKIIASSFTFIQLGAVIIPEEFPTFMLEVFNLCLFLMIKLTAPFVVLEFIIAITLGILMKLVPQIHVFVLSIQMKILSGFALLIIIFPNIIELTDEYMKRLFLAIQELLTLF